MTNEEEENRKLMIKADRISAFREQLTAMSLRNSQAGDQGKANHKASVTTIFKVIENLIN